MKATAGQPIDSRPTSPRCSTSAAEPVQARFIEALVEWSNPGSSIRAVHSYPNFGLVDASDERVIVMHHGHFVEHLYRIVSSLDYLFGDPSRGRPPTGWNGTTPAGSTSSGPRRATRATRGLTSGCSTSHW